MLQDDQTLSGWWRRVGAALFDGLVVGVPLTVLGVLVGQYSFHRNTAGREQAHIGAGYVIVSIVVFVLYAFVTNCRTGAHNGQSIGKQVCRIRIARDDGAPVDWRTVLVREIVMKSGPSWLGSQLGPVGLLFLFFPVVDGLWPLGQRENRAIHDMVARTHVVRTAVDEVVQERAVASA